MPLLRARWALLCLAFLGACHPQTPVTALPWDEQAEVAINGSAHGLEAIDAALGAAFAHDAAGAHDPASEAALEARYAPAAEALELARDALIDADRAVRDAVAIGSADARCRARVAVQRAADDAQLLLAQASALGAVAPAGLAPSVAMLASVAADLLPSCAPGTP